MDVREKTASEKRLIDYYYLAEKIECPGEPLVYWYDIEAAPTVDAVPVVRCKDCIKISPSVTEIKNAVWCRKFRAYMPCDGFCYYGERKEGVY